MTNPILPIVFLFCLGSFADNGSLNSVIREAVAGRDVACVFIDCVSGEVVTPDSAAVYVRYTPCSTFKIWNTLIGAECRLITSADAHFYTWDSVPRFFPAWNQNLTVKQAFQVSSVPAFQELARKIGYARMKKWIAALDYGDRDISSGIDDFWLPWQGKKSIEISPVEQARLVKKLVQGELPFSNRSQNILREVMMVGKTERAVYYGKTGSGDLVKGNETGKIGWFVGYVAGNERTYSFACLIKGKDASGKDAKGIIESILKKAGLL